MNPTNSLNVGLYHTSGQTESSSSSEILGGFSFRSVRGTNLNFSYHLKNKGIYDTDCITINTASSHKSTFFTFYTKNEYPDDWVASEVDKCAFIMPESTKHIPELHKRESPLDEHYHIEVSKKQDPDLVIKLALKNIGIKKENMNNLCLSAQYLIKNPSEPGLAFKDGSFTRNGGCKSLNDDSHNLSYIEGPYMLYKIK
ncbi:hypothetical protein [Endozoicomonas euniceicola]|uniref:Uncharacterized protein n=1 Tax=Endozoicomonas euniceicola TaxID=1234143 RepID=A0ABY6GN33_9GAMM|nr:hypothetical protein [Endozoicomonas euniceicola]UYM14121.1 hypothetical protein NX720_14520 [Endozoicomonas euniceicola]